LGGFARSGAPFIFGLEAPPPCAYDSLFKSARCSPGLATPLFISVSSQRWTFRFPLREPLSRILSFSLIF